MTYQFICIDIYRVSLYPLAGFTPSLLLGRACVLPDGGTPRKRLPERVGGGRGRRRGSAPSAGGGSPHPRSCLSCERTEMLGAGGRRSGQPEGLSTVRRRSAQGGLAAVTPWCMRPSACFLLPPLLLWYPVLAPRFVQASTSIYSHA